MGANVRFTNSVVSVRKSSTDREIRDDLNSITIIEEDNKEKLRTLHKETIECRYSNISLVR